MHFIDLAITFAVAVAVAYMIFFIAICVRMLVSALRGIK